MPKKTLIAIIALTLIPCTNSSAADARPVDDKELRNSRKALARKIDAYKKDNNVSRKESKILGKLFNKVELPERDKEQPMREAFDRQSYRYQIAKLDQFLSDITGQAVKTNTAGGVVPDISLTSNQYKIRVGPLDNVFFQIRDKLDIGTGDGRLTKAELDYLNREFFQFRKLRDQWVTHEGRIAGSAFTSLRKVLKQLSGLTDLAMANKLTEARTNPVAAKQSRGLFVNGHAVSQHFLWCPSRHGGYYEATGRINGIFSREQLELYGGRLLDGTTISASKPGGRHSSAGSGGL